MADVTNAQIAEALRTLGFGLPDTFNTSGGQTHEFKSNLGKAGISSQLFNAVRSMLGSGAGVHNATAIANYFASAGVSRDLTDRAMSAAKALPPTNAPKAGPQNTDIIGALRSLGVDLPQNVDTSGGQTHEFRDRLVAGGVPAELFDAARGMVADKVDFAQKTAVNNYLASAGLPPDVRDKASAYVLNPTANAQPAFQWTQPPAPAPAPAPAGAAAPAAPASAPAAVPTAEPKTKAEVAALQTALNAKGAGLTVDGIMGPKTRAAWQKQGGPGAPAAAPGGGTGTAASAATGGAGIQPPDVLARNAPVGDQIAYIKSHYGYAAWALDDPQIGPIILQAAKEGWDKARFEGEISGTNWWKTHDATQRVRQNEQGTDPATYGAGVAGAKATIQAEAGRQGVTIASDRLDQMATDAYNSGWKPDQVTAAVGAEFHYDPNAAKQPGEVGDLKSIASSYLVPLDNGTIQQWGGDILAGRSNDQAFTEYIKGQAKSLFPTMSAAIDAGQTVAQYVAPYKSTIAQTLEIDPESINFMDPKYMKLLTTIDPKTNAPVAKPLYQAMDDIRRDPTYGYQFTSQAKDQAASFSQKLAQTWGTA